MIFSWQDAILQQVVATAFRDRTVLTIAVSMLHIKWFLNYIFNMFIHLCIACSIGLKVIYLVSGIFGVLLQYSLIRFCCCVTYECFTLFGLLVLHCLLNISVLHSVKNKLKKKKKALEAFKRFHWYLNKFNWLLCMCAKLRKATHLSSKLVWFLTTLKQLVNLTPVQTSLWLPWLPVQEVTRQQYEILTLSPIRWGSEMS